MGHMGMGMGGCGMMMGGMMKGGMGGMMARASPYGMGMGPRTGAVGTSTVQNPEALPQALMMIDEKAKLLLQQLPEEKQIDLASTLLSKISQSGINNPSGWMVNSCIKAD